MSDQTLSPARKRLLLVAAFLVFSAGAAYMHAYTVFLVAFVDAFGWSRARVSIAYAVAQFVHGVTSPLTGLLTDRWGARRMVLMGGAFLAVGALGSAYATELWHLVILYGVAMTWGANCLGLVVFVPLLSRHFVSNRGMAVSVVQSANGFARAYSAPAATLMIEGLGWRGAYFWQGVAMAAAMVPMAWMFGRGDARAARSARAAEDGQGWTLRQAMRTPHFWLLSVVYMLTGLGSFSVSLHQLAFAVDRGFDTLYAASVLGMGAFLSFPGVILAGTVSDYIGREWAAIATYGVSIVGAAFGLLITGPEDHALLWLHACFFGLTWGARGPSITAKTADLFPGPNLGTILGAISIGTGVGSAGGSWLAGAVFDWFGSYRLAFALSIAFYACGAVVFWTARRHQGDPPPVHADSHLAPLQRQRRVPEHEPPPARQRRHVRLLLQRDAVDVVRRRQQLGRDAVLLGFGGQHHFQQRHQRGRGPDIVPPGRERRQRVLGQRARGLDRFQQRRAGPSELVGRRGRDRRDLEQRLVAQQALAGDVDALRLALAPRRHGAHDPQEPAVVAARAQPLPDRIGIDDIGARFG
jgi:MFS family permease